MAPTNVAGVNINNRVAEKNIIMVPTIHIPFDRLFEIIDLLQEAAAPAMDHPEDRLKIGKSTNWQIET